MLPKQRNEFSNWESHELFLFVYNSDKLSQVYRPKIVFAVCQGFFENFYNSVVYLWLHKSNTIVENTYEQNIYKWTIDVLWIKFLILLGSCIRNWLI